MARTFNKRSINEFNSWIRQYLAAAGNPIAGASGNIYCVKPYSGDDDSSGLAPVDSLKTLAEAYSRCTADKGDIVLMFAESNTAANTTDYQSTTLTWGKDLTHLIGIGAPIKVSQRSRITNLASTVVTPVVDFTGDGCFISNVQISNGYNDATALLAAQLTGSRNYFKNVHFAGVMGGTTQSAAGAADIKIDAGSENVFKGCVFGVDTIERDGDATGILFDSAATRNWFEDCMFNAYISAAGYAHITIADATGIDRWQVFKNCMFFAKSTNKATTQTSVFSIPAISQGAIILSDSYCASDGGAVDWDSNNRGIIWNNSVAAAASAAGGIFTNQ